MSRFGELLREWRNFRDTSQLALAHAAEISQRHMSFVESGRAQPSEPLVLRLAQLLGLGLRDRNSFLIAAGFAPRFGEGGWQSEALAEVRSAARLILSRHEPYPALVLDATSTVLDANDTALAWLGRSRAALGHIDLVELVFGAGPLRDSIENWHEVASYLLSRLREAALYRSPNSFVRPVYERALELARAAQLELTTPAAVGSTVLPVSLRVDGQVAHWLTTVTTFGAPQDALVEEITIELFYPREPPSAPLSGR